MADEIPKDPKDLAKEDRDALDTLALEAKEFEKVSSIPAFYHHYSLFPGILTAVLERRMPRSTESSNPSG
jgi:hypothetical protein